MERKRRRGRDGYKTREEFEDQLFPWMCLIAVFAIVIYVAVSILINPWLFFYIPLAICGVLFALVVVVGIACGLTSFIGECREMLGE